MDFKKAPYEIKEEYFNEINNLNRRIKFLENYVNHISCSGFINDGNTDRIIEIIMMDLNNYITIVNKKLIQLTKEFDDIASIRRVDKAMDDR